MKPNDKQDDKIILTNYNSLSSRKPTPADKRANQELIDIVRAKIKDANLPHGVICVADISHTDVPTSKFLVYSQKGMDEAIKSYYEPLPKPFVLNHNVPEIYEHNNSVPIGRVLHAMYVKGKVETPMGVASGTLKAGIYIADYTMMPDGVTRVIDALKTRQILNLSINATSSRNNVVCSICGKHPLLELPVEANSPCAHYPGEQYDGKLCTYVISDLEFHELSAIMLGADPAAFITTVVMSDSSSIPFKGIGRESSKASSYDSSSGEFLIYDSSDDSIEDQYQQKGDIIVNTIDDDKTKIIQSLHSVDDKLDKVLTTDSTTKTLLSTILKLSEHIIALSALATEKGSKANEDVKDSSTIEPILDNDDSNVVSTQNVLDNKNDTQTKDYSTSDDSNNDVNNDTQVINDTAVEPKDDTKSNVINDNDDSSQLTDNQQTPDVVPVNDSVDKKPGIDDYLKKRSLYEISTKKNAVPFKLN